MSNALLEQLYRQEDHRNKKELATKNTTACSYKVCVFFLFCRLYLHFISDDFCFFYRWHCACVCFFFSFILCVCSYGIVAAMAK